MQRIAVPDINFASMSFYNSSIPYDWLDQKVVIPSHEDGSIMYTNRAGGSVKSQTPHPGNGVPYIFSTRFNGINNIAYFNGTALNTVASTGNFAIDNILIGTRWGDGGPVVGVQYYYIGYIGELIIFDRALTNTERKDVTQYLSNKWGIKVQ